VHPTLLPSKFGFGGNDGFSNVGASRTASALLESSSLIAACNDG